MIKETIYRTRKNLSDMTRTRITFDEWKWIKLAMENTQPVDESYLKLCRELLGHLPRDKETLI